MLPANYEWVESRVQPGRWELHYYGRLCAVVSVREGGTAWVTLNCDAPVAAPRKHGTAKSVTEGQKHAEWWAAWRERRAARQPGSE